MKTKLILFFISFFAISIFLTTKTFAQTPKENLPVQNNPHSLPLNTNPDVPQNINTYTQTTFINVLATASCFLTGYDPLSTTGKCLGIDPETKKIGYIKNGNGGLVSLAGGMIGSTYNIPVSSVEYGKYVASNFGITHSSYAQTANQQCLGTPPESMGACLDAANAKSGFGKGIGFVGLTPVLKIWQTFRNLIYLLFVLIFIVLGLGIMFRINIDARTVMTIQNQIPKIVIALVLITMSYAIAGFLIDMMYVSIYLVIQLFHTQGLATITNIDTNPINAVGSLGGISDIATPAARGVGSILGSLFNGGIGESLARIVSALLGSILGGNIGGSLPLVGGVLGGILGTAAGAGLGLAFGPQIFSLIALIIAYLIIVIAILSSLFRVWFMLIKAYVYIILDVIFAPFWIVKGIIPGAGGGVGPWLRSLLANLAAFPVVIILFLVGKTVQDNVVAGTGNFIPPLVGDPGADSAGTVASIIGLGIILIMPEAVTITKQAIKAPDYKLAGAAQRAIGVGQGVISKPFGAAKSEFFGKDAFGNPRAGSRFIGSYFGRGVAALTGGGFDKSKYDENNTEKTKLFRNPLTGLRNWRSGRKTRREMATTAETRAKEDARIAEAQRQRALHQLDHGEEDGGGGATEPSPAPGPQGPEGEEGGDAPQPMPQHGDINGPTERSDNSPEGEEGGATNQTDPQSMRNAAFEGGREGAQTAGGRINDTIKDTTQQGIERARREDNGDDNS